MPTDAEVQNNSDSKNNKKRKIRKNYLFKEIK